MTRSLIPLLLSGLVASCGGAESGPASPPPAYREAVFPKRAFGYDLHIYGVGAIIALDSATYGGSDTLTLLSGDSTFTGGPARIVTVGDTVWATFRYIDSTQMPVLDTVLALWLWAPGRDDFVYERLAGEQYLDITGNKNPVHELFFVIPAFWQPPHIISLWQYSGTDGRQTVVMRWGGALPGDTIPAIRARPARGGSLVAAVVGLTADALRP